MGDYDLLPELLIGTYAPEGTNAAAGAERKVSEHSRIDISAIELRLRTTQ
jgi:hypothetical protein